MRHVKTKTDDLTSVDIAPLSGDGTAVWVQDADIPGGTQVGKRRAPQRIPDATCKLDLQVLEALRAEAQLQLEAHNDVTQVVGPTYTGLKRHGPPPPAQPAQWFDDLDLQNEDTSPGRPLPWMADSPAPPAPRRDPPVRAGNTQPIPRRQLLAQAEVAIVDMAYRYPGWGMVRVTNALRREGVDVNVKEVSEVLSRYGVWSTLGQAAMQKAMNGRAPRGEVNRRYLLAFELLAFITLTVAVGVAWFSI